MWAENISSILITEEILFAMVQAVSEDKEFNTIEFNEFLVMMSKQQQTQREIQMEEMMELVRYVLHVLLIACIGTPGKLFQY